MTYPYLYQLYFFCKALIFNPFYNALNPSVFTTIDKKISYKFKFINNFNHIFA